MSQGIKGRHPKTLEDFEPGLARRIRSAWSDPEVETKVMQRHFGFSGQVLQDLVKCLGPRVKITMAPVRGKVPWNKIRNRGVK